MRPSFTSEKEKYNMNYPHLLICDINDPDTKITYMAQWILR